MGVGKTNKSFTKRLKLTRNGKIISRKTGQNHFNSKESRRSQLSKKRSSPVSFLISKENVGQLFNK